MRVGCALSKSSPVGTAESSPGRSPGYMIRETSSPAGTADKMPQDAILGYFYSGFGANQDHVLGNIQPSLWDVLGNDRLFDPGEAEPAKASEGVSGR